MWHLGKLLVLPLIAMIAGLTSLYIDPKQNPWGKKILLAVLLIGAAGSVAIAVSDDHDKQQEDQKASDNARDMRNIGHIYTCLIPAFLILFPHRLGCNNVPSRPRWRRIKGRSCCEIFLSR